MVFTLGFCGFVWAFLFVCFYNDLKLALKITWKSIDLQLKKFGGRRCCKIGTLCVLVWDNL